MPSRRRLLRTGGLALGLGLAGCLAGDGDDPAAGTTTTASTSSEPSTPNSSTTTTTASAPPTASTIPDSPPEVREVDSAAVAERGVPRSPDIESDTYEPFRGFVVGVRPDSPGNYYQTPHVWVWNLTGDSTTMTVAVTTGGTELRRVEAEFPAGEPLAVVFRERRAYEVTVRVGDRERSVTVEPDRFWCNATGTDVEVRPDDIEAGTVSTSMACTTMPEDTTTAGGS